MAFRTVQAPAALDNPPLQCRSGDAIYTDADHNFDHRRQPWRRLRGGPFLLGFHHEQMRGIVGGFGQHIEAMAAADWVGDGHGAPSAHENRV